MRALPAAVVLPVSRGEDAAWTHEKGEGMQEIALQLASAWGHRSAGEIIVLLCFLLFLATKGLYWLNSDRSKARQEFLQLWDMERAQRDPLWCEVLIRHCFREFLPARMSINAASDAHAALTLSLISHSVRFYQLDDGLVQWRRARHRNAVISVMEIAAGFLVYLALAPASMLLMLQVIRNHQSMSIAVLTGIIFAGLVLFAVAIRALNHGFALATARRDFFKIQTMRPLLVPEPLESFGLTVRKLSAATLAKRTFGRGVADKASES